MKLLEILDSRSKFRIIDTEPSLFGTKARIGNRDIYFSSNRTDPNSNAWSIQFSERTPKGIKGVNDNFATTGSGNELEVFSFIAQSLKKFISSYHPDEINFKSSKKEGRTNLYKNLIKRVSLPGYSLADVEGTNEFYDTFRIVKNSLLKDKQDK